MLDTNVPPKTRELIAAGLSLANDQRGGHSWGFSNGVKVKKGVGEISRHVKAARLGQSLTLMAHTRYATTGAQTIANAHPFTIGQIIGAHNGIITNHAELNETFRRRCTVDSQHIFHHLHEQRPLKTLQGYGTITYHLAGGDGSIYLGTFNGGALAIGSLTKGQTMLGVVYSSTQESLARVLSLAGVTWTPYHLTDGHLYAIYQRALYTTTTRLDISPGLRVSQRGWMAADA